MATKTNKATATKRKAAAPTSNSAAPTQKAKGGKAAQAAVTQAPLFTMGHWPNVRPATIRAYAQATAATLAKASPKGFTLAAYRAALVAGAAASSVTPPKGGWARHNMPTWAAHAKQQWIVPVK